MSAIFVAAVVALWVCLGIAVAVVFGMASLIGRRPGEEDSRAH